MNFDISYDDHPPFGPTGREVYERTYRRIQSDGEPETWRDTVTRVVDGNLGLVDGRFHERDEREKLLNLFYNFKALPAGRHLWMSGVPGRQFLMNCWRAGWHKDIATHFAFTFDQLMQGGGVGANYSNRYIEQYGPVEHVVDVHLVCDPDHDNYDEVEPYLSTEYSYEWDGSIRIDDSREGWIDALARILRAFWNGERHLVFDLSLIRHRGARIRTFGGTAAGPAPLAIMLTNVVDLLTKRVGKTLTSLDVMLIDHYIATCVVSGNVRRCIPETTQVHTDKGMVKVRDIHVGDRVLTTRGYRPVRAVFNQGEQELVDVVLATGKVFTCTPNHRVAVLSDAYGGYEWKQAEFLVPDDRVLFPEVACGPALRGATDAALWVLGLFAGDGCFSRRTHANTAEIIFSCNRQDNLAPLLVDRLRGLGYDPRTHWSSKNCAQVKLYGNPEKFSWLNIKEPYGEITIPERVWRGTVVERGSFLAGLYDADGQVDGKALVWSSAEQFIRDVQDLYASLGIVTKLVRGHTPRAKEHRQSWYLAPVNTPSTMQRLSDLVLAHTSKVDPAVWVRQKAKAGFVSVPKEFVKSEVPYVDFAKYNRCKDIALDSARELVPPDHPFVPVKVVEVINRGETGYTYDIEVEDQHEFYAEGLLVHNSARMSIKSWRDHDIIDFITCKQDPMFHWSTNISVEIDNDFFRSLRKGDQHAEVVYRTVVEGMLTNGEPGFFNLSLASVGELTDVASTNPCGELALNEWEYCCLGHVNLDRFPNDFEGAVEAHRLMTRFLLRATFGDIPNALSQEVGTRNRRIGVGHFGFQGWLVKQGIRFSESYRDPYVRKTLRDFYDVVRKEARRYAFALRIPEPIKLTTVAPTGTIAKLPGASEGIHPIYAKYFIRRIRYSTVDEHQQQALHALAAAGHHIEDDIYTTNTKVVDFYTKDTLIEDVEVLGLDAENLVESAGEIDLADMLGVQTMYQDCYADNAISFTINVKPETYSVDDAMATMIHYLPKIKGTTIMVDGSRPQAPYERISREEFEAAGITHVADGIDESCASGACPVR